MLAIFGGPGDYRLVDYGDGLEVRMVWIKSCLGQSQGQVCVGGSQVCIPELVVCLSALQDQPWLQATCHKSLGEREAAEQQLRTSFLCQVPMEACPLAWSTPFCVSSGHIPPIIYCLDRPKMQSNCEEASSVKCQVPTDRIVPENLCENDKDDGAGHSSVAQLRPCLPTARLLYGLYKALDSVTKRLWRLHKMAGKKNRICPDLTWHSPIWRRFASIDKMSEGES
jgi:hypothetical protein